MRLKLTLAFFFCFVVDIVFSQSITIVPTNIASPAKGTVDFNDTTNQLQYWNGTVWIPITNAASGTGWGLSGADIYNSNTGKVFIGATPSAFNAKLNIITPSGGYGLLHSNNTVNIASYAGGSLGFFGTTSNHPFQLVANGSTQMTVLPNGNIGLGISNPTNKLQVGSVGSTGFSTNDFALGNGTNAMAIFQTNAATLVGSSTDIVLKPRNNGTGNVGINVDSPTNKLQIGSMGGTGFAGNDFALGNGTEAFGIYQTNTETQLGASKNIILKPTYGNGRVGINTTTPRATLDVVGYANVDALNTFFTQVNNASYIVGFVQGNSPPGTYLPDVSIVAQGSIYARTYNAYSDSRIKNIIGISNSAIDLETVKALEITDYTMKDKIQQGNKVYKKVIAQQVEKFYPQAVNKFTDVIPDIYALAEKVVFDEEFKTLTISLTNSYNIKIGEKIEFIHEKEGKIKAEVVAVSGNNFTVKDWKYATDKIFVYGREVDDFRTIDYEAISMLGISAIQELAKKNEELASEIKNLKANNQQLNTRLEIIENLILKPQSGK